MHPFCNNGWAYYEKVQEIMLSYARGTMLFHPAEGPPVSVNSRVDPGSIMIGGGVSREAGGGDGRDHVQGDEDDIMGAQDGVPIPPIPSSGSKCKLLTDNDITGDLISSSKSHRTSTTSFSSRKLKPKSVAGVMADGLDNIGGMIDRFTSVLERSLITPGPPDLTTLAQAEALQLVQHYDEGLEQREKIRIVSYFASNPQAPGVYLVLNDVKIRKGWLYSVLDGSAGHSS
jgi:hypothetical protein